MVKIAFLENHFSVRGTSVALFDYAHFNEKLLKNESIIITRPYDICKQDIDSNEEIYKKFENRFPKKMFYYYQPIDVQKIINDEKPDILYIIKSGDKGDGLHSFNNVKIIIHCVFSTTDPHGDIYTPISNFVNLKYNTKYEVFPHMISLFETDENLRKELNIPENAIVFGRHGGLKEFDISDARHAVDRISRENENIYFIFLNTEVFCTPRKNIIHFEKTSDIVFKTKFINTCDAMIYGRSTGESFGLAIGEFSIKNKPIICTDRHTMNDHMHKIILKDNALWYHSQEECYQIMKHFDKEKAKTKDWNMYKEYEPEKVMNIFKNMIDKLLN